MPASVVEERVAFTLEPKINGVENLERLCSRFGHDGSYSLELAFGRGANPNLAEMLVENRVNDAIPLLPEEVRWLGATVRKASRVLVMLLTVSSTGRSAGICSDLNKLASVYFRPQLARVPGVGQASLHGSDGMSARILLDPQLLTPRCGPRPQRLIKGPMSRLRQLLPSAGDRDNRLMRRTRAALDAWPAGPMPGPRTVALTPDPGHAGSRRGAPGSPDPGGPGTGRQSGRTRGRGGRARLARAGR
jgi:hypothetical protein